MQTILVPTDFSKIASSATKLSIDIAKRVSAGILLLHVVEIAETLSFTIEGEIEELDFCHDKPGTQKRIEDIKTQMRAIISMASDAGVRAEYEIRVGNVLHSIREAITDYHVNLVVMGTSERSCLEEMIVGSNTEKVIRHAACPVLTVHENARFGDFKNIVYASSLSEDEIEFGSVLKKTQELFDATIHLVRINTPENFKDDAAAKRQMRKFAEKLKLTNFTLNVFNHFSEEEGIINFADHVNADLVSMSTHGRTGLAQLMSGSIAEGVANYSTRPVLTYVSRRKYY